MSGLDQPLLIATTGYHVGHQRSIRVAEEQGYFKEEGLNDYVYDYRGLIPGPLERQGLALAMKEHGVDVACGANADSAILARARGEDAFVVGGWRYMTRPKIVSAQHITRIEDLRGTRIGLRELGGLTDRAIIVELIRVGLDPQKDVEWVEDPVFAYPNNAEHTDLLRSGKLDVITTSGAYVEALVKDGFHLLIDGSAPERRRRPGRVIVATSQTIEQRAEELKAFLKANVRAYWFWMDAANFDYLYDLETRMRRDYTHNEDERGFRMTRRAPRMEDSLFPLDGRVDPDQLQYVIEEMRLLGELTAPVQPGDILRGELMASGFAELSDRPSLQSVITKVRAAL